MEVVLAIIILHYFFYIALFRLIFVETVTRSKLTLERTTQIRILTPWLCFQVGTVGYAKPNSVPPCVRKAPFYRAGPFKNYTKMTCWKDLPRDGDAKGEGDVVLARGDVHHRGGHRQAHHGVGGRHACNRVLVSVCIFFLYTARKASPDFEICSFICIVCLYITRQVKEISYLSYRNNVNKQNKTIVAS